MVAFGYIPDPVKGPYQKQDWSAAELLGDSSPPETGSAREHVLSILDQGPYPTCVMNAIVQALRACHSRLFVPYPQLASRLFGNYLSKATFGGQHLNQGTYIRAAFDVMNLFGFPMEEFWPYLDVAVTEDSVERWAMMPPANAFRMAIDQRRPLEFRRVYETGYARQMVIQRAISQKRVLVYGTVVSDVIHRYRGEVLDPPTSRDSIAGGHAMCWAEYDQNKVGGPNSHGLSRGDNGWLWMTWDYACCSLTQDIWIVDHVPYFLEETR